MKKGILTTFILGILMCACSSKDKNAALEISADSDTVSVVKTTEPNSDLVTLTIASKTSDCTGVAKQKCLLVKEDDATDWIYWYTGIEGFDYQEGYEYVLEVRKEAVEDTPADASTLKYVFMKEISKTEKESADMPEIKE